MAITFYTQSKKSSAVIWVRYREGSIDAKAATSFRISPDQLIKGSVKYLQAPPSVDARLLREIKDVNNNLNDLQNELNLLRSKIITALNERKSYEAIDSTWLKELLNPKIGPDVSNELVDYFDFYLESKSSSLEKSTIKKMRTFKNRIEDYEREYGRIYIQEVNRKFSLSLQRWCDMKKLAHNTKVKTVKVVLTVCNHASEHGVETSPELKWITKGLKEKKVDHIHLNFEELDKISKTDIEDEKISIARDWLIISCYTAQRVSDFLRFSKENIIIREDEYLLDIRQEKTDKPIYIPLSEEVLEILNKRDGRFPPIFSKNEDSNRTIYNKLIKEVCRLSGLDELVSALMRNTKTNRYELKKVPKFKAVSSHIGRRSFATNFYGRIPTPLLISATGHASEVQFLRYVGKTRTHSAILLAKEMRNFNLNHRSVE